MKSATEITLLMTVQTTPSVHGGDVSEPIYLKYFLLPNLISPGLTIPKCFSSSPLMVFMWWKSCTNQKPFIFSNVYELLKTFKGREAVKQAYPSEEGIRSAVFVNNCNDCNPSMGTNMNYMKLQLISVLQNNRTKINV